MIFYTSDIHFSDDKIRRLCGRPYESVDDMNDAIIKGWNGKVKAQDTIYILGDIFPCDGGVPNEILGLAKKLSGRKILVVGNHDEPYLKEIRTSGVFARVEHLAHITDNVSKLALCHYPLMSWQGDENGSIHLYGHIHNKKLPEIERYYTQKKAYNVGLDVRRFEPVGLDEIMGGSNAHSG